jgi:hypothetical protein
MRLLVIYRPKSEHARVVDEFIFNYEQRGDRTKVEVVDFDSAAAQSMLGIYGIVQHPTILALRDDGQLMKQWEGPQMPLIDEVISYLH